MATMAVKVAAMAVMAAMMSVEAMVAVMTVVVAMTSMMLAMAVMAVMAVVAMAHSLDDSAAYEWVTQPARITVASQDMAPTASNRESHPSAPSFSPYHLPFLANGLGKDLAAALAN